MTYYYEHANGTVRKKPDIVVDMGGGPHEYFNSPYCKKWWHSDGAQDDLITRPDPPKGIS